MTEQGDTEHGNGPAEAHADGTVGVKGSSGGDGPGGAADAAAELEALQRKADEHWELYVRAAAELENMRRRAQRDVENARKYGVERLAERLLPVLDSLDAGVNAGPADAAALLEGTRATLRLLLDALESAGIRPIEPAGVAFDPTRHEAIAMRPAPEVEPGTVLEVVQKGFEIQGRLLRPARVVVAQEPAQGPAS